MRRGNIDNPFFSIATFKILLSLNTFSLTGNVLFVIFVVRKTLPDKLVKYFFKCRFNFERDYGIIVKANLQYQPPRDVRHTTLTLCKLPPLNLIQSRVM